MNDIDTAYIAGLFDGEGTCAAQAYQATKNGKHYVRVVARITNTDKRCLDFVKATWGGGWVGVNNRATEHRKTCFNFQITNAAGESFLSVIRPFVKVKGEQIDRALSARCAAKNQTRKWASKK